MNKPFFFIGNILKPKIKTPVELIPGYSIQKANHIQIQLIKQKLSIIKDAAASFFFNINEYESEYTQEKKDSYRIKRLFGY